MRADGGKKLSAAPAWADHPPGARKCGKCQQSRGREGADRYRYTLKELPQPQVDFTFGLPNLNPEPSRVST